MTDNDIRLPDVKKVGRSVALHMIEKYIEEAGPAVGPSESGEKFIGGLMEAFKAVQLSPLQVNAHLERIANNNFMPDHVVDAALKAQDELIESTPALKADRDALQEEYSHLIHPAP